MHKCIHIHLYVPDGACGVDAAGAQMLWVSLTPIEGRERGTEIALLVLRKH